MSIKRSIATKITNAINVAFKKVGNTNGTNMPPDSKPRNTEGIAWEYHVASQLKRVADARKKEAFEACITAELFPDPVEHPSASGTKETVYTGNLVNITLTVKTAATRVSIDDFCQLLQDSKVPDKIIKECRAGATTTNRPAHEYSTSLLTNGD